MYLNKYFAGSGKLSDLSDNVNLTINKRLAMTQKSSVKVV